jgi:predicted PurR-regulated permease PerM
VTPDPHPTRPAVARGPWLTPGRLLQLVAVLLASYAALAMIRTLRTILIVLLVSVFLSFAMEPAVQWLERRGWRRGRATMAVFLGAITAFIAAVSAILPVLIQQIVGLINSAPRSVEDLERLLSRIPLPFMPDPQRTSTLQVQLTQLTQNFSDELQQIVLGAAGSVLGLGRTAVGAVVQLFTVALVTYYLVADGPRLRQVLARPLEPDRQRTMLAILEMAISKTGGYVYSRVLLAAVCALLHAVFLGLIGVPYPVPLGLWVGLTSAFVPVVGTYLGGTLLVIVALANEPIDALWVLIFIILYQQVENLVIAPRIQARTMDVHPAVAFLSVLVGGTLLGAVGALLALPATAIIQALLSTYVHRHELIHELEDFEIDVTPPAHGSRAPSREPRVDETRAASREPPTEKTKDQEVGA